MKTEIFVTGGVGFVGYHLCNLLLSKGHRVVCYDKLDRKTTNPATIRELKRSPDFELIEGDILDLPTLTSAIKRPDAIIHLAAISSVDQSIKNPIEAVQINGIGTLNVLEAARAKGINRIHYASTDEVFGHSESGVFDENTSTNPRNPYAAGKLAGEAICHAWQATYKVDTTISNSANNFGTHQVPEKLIPRLTVRAIQGNTLPVYGDGKQVREWIHVKDHASAIYHILLHGLSGEKYCVGSGEQVENLQIVKTILNVLHLTDSSIQHVEDRKGHDLRYALDSSKIQSLGWKPDSHLSDSLSSTIEWYLQNISWWEYYIQFFPDLRKIESHT